MTGNAIVVPVECVFGIINVTIPIPQKKFLLNLFDVWVRMHYIPSSLSLFVY